MRSVRTLIALGFTSATFLLGAVVAPSAASARPRVDVLLTGLSSPKGLAVTADENPVVAQGAFGPPGPVLIYQFRGPNRGEATPVTDPINLVDVAVSPLDGSGWGISEGVLLHQLTDGTIVPVLDITAYQAQDPDPFDQEGIPDESNAYGLAVMANGDALVADAAGNDLIRVSPSGEATTMARFDVETVSTDHIPPDFELPPGVELPAEIDAEAVPTSVAIGSDGAVYVGELKGFPFRPGSSHVWRIDPDADGVLCSVNTPDDACTVAADGLTAINDIAINVKNDNLYVLELAADGVLAFEAGFVTGEFPPAVLLRVRDGRQTELVPGALSQPGGLVVRSNGTVFVTDGVFNPEGGRLALIRGV